jgi:hypothetical protein
MVLKEGSSSELKLIIDDQFISVYKAMVKKTGTKKVAMIFFFAIKRSIFGLSFFRLFSFILPFF